MFCKEEKIKGGMEDDGKIRFRYFVRDELVPFDEDETHEFKGHSNVIQSQIPVWSEATKSRTRISRALCAFLNTGKGGTVYIGILDNGTVKGLHLTNYKMDHFKDVVRNTFRYYVPPVEKHRYSINMVSVVSSNAAPADIDDRAKYELRNQDISNRGITGVPHELTGKKCWCDIEHDQRRNQGLLSPAYVIEVVIHPWNAEDSRNQNAMGLMKMYPIHQDEEGHVYMRRAASCVAYSALDILHHVDFYTQQHYLPKIATIVEDMEKLKVRCKELEENLQIKDDEIRTTQTQGVDEGVGEVRTTQGVDKVKTTQGVGEVKTTQTCGGRPVTE